MNLTKKLFLLLLFSVKLIFSQDFEIKKFTVEDGLFSNEVEKLFLDSKGVLWIKCGKGICSYDGRQISQYTDGQIISGYGEFSENNKEVHYPSVRGIVYTKLNKLERERVDSSICMYVDKEKEAIKVAEHIIDKNGYHYFDFHNDSVINIYKKGKVTPLNIYKYSNTYGDSKLILDNNKEVWLIFTKNEVSTLFKLNNNSLPQNSLKIKMGSINGLHINSNGTICLANDKEVVIYQNNETRKFSIPITLPFNYYSDNIISNSEGDFWMPYNKGLMQINLRGIKVHENPARPIKCDYIEMLSYDRNGKETRINEYACEDFLFNYDIEISKSGHIITGNECFINGNFLKIADFEERCVIYDLLIDNENHIWMATSNGLYQCNYSIISKSNEKSIYNDIEFIESIKKNGNQFISASKLRIYHNRTAIDSVPLTFKYSTTQSYESRNGFVFGKKLKKGVLIITKEEVLLYTNKKLNVPNLKNLQKNKYPLIIHQPGRRYTSEINYSEITMLGEWFYFNFGNYIYKTDGQNLICFGKEIGLKDTINYFIPIKNPKNEHTINWSDELIATNKNLYKITNDKLIRIESADLFSSDVSLLTAISDSRKRNFLIRTSFNRITKLYQYSKNGLIEREIDNPNNLSFIDYNSIIKTSNQNKYVFHTRQSLVGMLSFENDKPSLLKLNLPENVSTSYGTIELVKDNIIIFPLDEPMSICKLDITKNIITAVKSFKKYNHFEAPETSTTDSTILFNQFLNSDWSFYKINFNKPIFNQIEPITTFEFLRYYCNNDTIEKEELTNIEIPYNFNPLIIYFKGVCLSDGSKVKFKYLLDGLDKNWQETTEENVTISTLPAGTYKFKLIACNNDGLWNKTPIEFSFTVMPPWYKTWWAYSSYVLIGFAGVFGFVKNRTQQLEKEKQKLEKTVEERTAEIVEQKHLIEEKNKEITDSIHYAQKIQHTLLASQSLLNDNLKDYFVFFKPKDIVSGDFYWAAKHETGFLIITADCTGHGVPGAFMSLLSISYLNEITKEQKITQPDKVFNLLRDKIISNFDSDNSEHERKDGMDAVICNYNFNSNRLQFAAANNPLWLMRNGELLEYKPDKMPVGRAAVENKPFNLQELQLEKGDIIYTLTDGYADQFGGPKGKKFMYKQMKELIASISHLPMQEQKEKLESEINAWKGNTEQVDDILVIGIRI